MSEPREQRRDFYVMLALVAVATALLYALDVPYREGWMYWIGVPALTFAIACLAWLAYSLFRRWRNA